MTSYSEHRMEHTPFHTLMWDLLNFAFPFLKLGHVG